MKQSIFVLASLLVATSALGQEDRPTVGRLDNTVDRSSLEYTCTLTSNQNEISCSFAQVMVSKAAKPDDLQKNIDDAIEQFRERHEKPETCKLFEDLLAVLDGKPSAADAEMAAHLSKLNQQEKVDTKRLFTAFLNLCRQPDAANATELARIIHEQDMRTCRISTHQFTQVFRRAVPSKTWSVVSEPTGDVFTAHCGIVNLSRFEQAPRGWEYYSRKAVTNPNELTLGGKCSEVLDEREYKYERGGEKYQMGCDYISFKF